MKATARRRAAVPLGIALVAAVLVPVGAAQAADPGDELPPQEPGITLRVFDVGFEPEQICELTEGQTPNIDVLRPTVDWVSDEDFGGIGNNFMAHVIGNIHVPEDGSYDFRIISDDGSRLSLNGTEIIENDRRQPPTAADGTAELTAGAHALRVDYFQGAYDKALRLEWKPPGAAEFALVPESVLTTDAGVTRVTSPGVKRCAGDDTSPGDGRPLVDVHPDYTVTDLRPDGFEPMVTGMDWFDDERMVITTWAGRESFDGAVEIVTGTVGEDADPAEVTTEVVATGMNEPQGVLVEDGEVIVAEKHQLSRLVDAEGDGFYEGSEAIASWPSGGTYHEFGFGLLADEEYYYLNLSVAITPGGRTTVPQHVENRGTSVRIDKETGELEYVAGGLRTPNGIGWGPAGEVYVTDNQGDWLPSSKLVRIEEGAFYNHHTTPPGPFDDQPVTEPVLWLPHGEISNSPTNPVTIEEGVFAGQLAFGDVTYGGIQRAFLEEVDGQQQGAVFRLTQGLESGVSRLALGPDGSFYVGGIGGGGNWEQPGKLPYGLQKLTPTGQDAMDIVSMEVTEAGFDLTYTKPVAADVLANLAERYQVQQWSYNPTSQYGGPKRNLETLTVAGASVSDDGRTVRLELPGLREDRVAHVRSPRPFAAADGTELWSTEAWYTVHNIPGYQAPPNPIGQYEAEDGLLSGGADIDDEHGNHTGEGFVDGFDTIGAELTWTVDVAEAGTYPVTFRYANGPNPYVGTKTISLDVNGADLGQLAVETTEVWNAWADHVVPLDLQAGRNTITVAAGEDDDRHVNWDHLRIQEEVCSPAEPDAGYRMLFDGTTESLAGWEMAGPGDFVAQADCTMRSVGGLGLLTHPEEFTDYRLKLDWKMGGDDNSGVHIGVPDPQGDPAARNGGFEVQIDATDVPELTTGAIYDFQGADIAARDAALNPPGEWNAYEIVVEDLRVRVYLNGVLINDYDTEGADPARDLSSGRVGLQNHHTGSDVWFRNVQIMPLG
ncbi:family 16 glycoside hydrolase [Streptomyces sp. DSM 44915]|uniref:Family 16 glycoside hydrolase n=1 Tax=Streptomyces chisholmiae TaxID=3075540 RepID=A0ABU2JYJ9_9ACTN|nr:family 16 glycoside hydrolase [Streptomyces sp. DSM 44915]MDT0270072.1 family 16 glycoside hydrolase [Streptomyces sp. DSM 44915]